MLGYIGLYVLITLVGGINRSQATEIPSSTRIESNECPLNGSTKNIFLPAENCHHYYKCINGKRQLFHCPLKQKWNKQLLKCDWSKTTDCFNENDSVTLKSRIEIVTPLNDIPECTEENAVKSAENCQSYYQCIHGKFILRFCPPGLEWSPNNECDWPNIAKCSKQEPNICSLNAGQKFLPGEDCEHYYACSNGKPILMSCPAGLHWSQTIQRCEWPAIAQCSEDTN